MNTFSFSEKRKKNQVNNLLNFYLSALSYFDFASFQLLQNLQELYSMQKGFKKIKYIDLLIFSCFIVQKEKFYLNKYLKKFLKFFFQESLGSKQKKISIFEKIFLQKTFFFFKEPLKNNIDFFFENLFLKNFDDQLNPIINSEKFLLEIIQRAPLNFKNVLQIFYKKTSQWYIFRYKLFRHLYFQEIVFCKKIKKDYLQYFYILQKYNPKQKIKGKLEKGNKKLTILKFDNFWKNFLPKRKYISKSLILNKNVLNFRTMLINYLLKSNFQLVLEDQIILNNKKKIKRAYQKII